MMHFRLDVVGIAELYLETRLAARLGTAAPSGEPYPPETRLLTAPV